TAQGESLPSAEVSTAVGPGGAISVDWGDVPGALSYRIYRGMTTAGSESGYFTSLTPTFFDDGTHTLTGGSLPTSTPVTAIQTTIPIAVDADPSVVQAALVELPTIGNDQNGDPNVHVTGTPGHYVVEFQHDLGNQAIAALLIGNTSSLRSNGLHAVLTLDGGADPDQYDVNQIGGTTASLVNVF